MITGIGVDVVDIARIDAIIASRGERLLQRVLTADELQYCQRKASPARHVAARIAAKEAAFKALSGTDDARAIGWREIEVQVDSHGRPSLALHGRALWRARELGIARHWLSLTHGEGVAVAFVVLETGG